MGFQLIDWPIENHFLLLIDTIIKFKDVYEFRDRKASSSLISQEGNADKYAVYSLYGISSVLIIPTYILLHEKLVQYSY